ncbi:MAG: SIMPL domain-containing protein, partial [Dehalococcoidales bacterium]
MKKRLLLAIGIALVIVAIGVVGCTSFPSSEPDTSGIIWSQQNRGIWVTGEGKVAVVPDVAILSLGIETQEA